MLEIKNRFSDSVPITGNQNWNIGYKMQLQMNVCELNDVIFGNTLFEYDDKDAFDADGTFTHTEDGKRKEFTFVC